MEITIKLARWWLVKQEHCVQLYFLHAPHYIKFSWSFSFFIKSKVGLCVHKPLPLNSVLSQINPVHISVSYLLQTCFNIILVTQILFSL
jgi:hypothetical protein